MDKCEHRYSDKQWELRSDGSGYWNEHVSAEVTKDGLYVHIGADDFYADGGNLPIKFCPFCGEKVESINEKSV